MQNPSSSLSEADHPTQDFSPLPFPFLGGYRELLMDDLGEMTSLGPSGEAVNRDGGSIWQDGREGVVVSSSIQNSQINKPKLPIHHIPPPPHLQQETQKSLIAPEKLLTLLKAQFKTIFYDSPLLHKQLDLDLSQGLLQVTQPLHLHLAPYILSLGTFEPRQKSFLNRHVTIPPFGLRGGDRLKVLRDLRSRRQLRGSGGGGGMEGSISISSLISGMNIGGGSLQSLTSLDPSSQGGMVSTSLPSHATSRILSSTVGPTIPLPPTSILGPSYSVDSITSLSSLKQSQQQESIDSLLNLHSLPTTTKQSPQPTSKLLARCLSLQETNLDIAKAIFHCATPTTEEGKRDWCSEYLVGFCEEDFEDDDGGGGGGGISKGMEIVRFLIEELTADVNSPNVEWSALYAACSSLKPPPSQGLSRMSLLPPTSTPSIISLPALPNSQHTTTTPQPKQDPSHGNIPSSSTHQSLIPSGPGQQETSDSLNQGKLKLITYLLQTAGARPNGSPDDPQPPLYKAAFLGCLTGCKLLIEAGADPNCEFLDDSSGGGGGVRVTPLMGARMKKRWEVIEYLEQLSTTLASKIPKE